MAVSPHCQHLHCAELASLDRAPQTTRRPRIQAFAGRVGGNQALVLNERDEQNADVLRKIPDSALSLTWSASLDLSGFLDIDLWRLALVECIGTLVIVVSTGWVSLVPSPSPTAPIYLPGSGLYGTSSFIAPLIGAIFNWLILTLLVYSFSSTSGAQLNPTISFATFFTRLVTFPRLALYVSGQICGAALGGLILRSGYGSKHFTIGGCMIDTDQVPVSDALLLDFTFTFILILFSFGVGLDPRQAAVIGPTLAPWLVGLVLGIISLGSSFTRPGYKGAALNPARCLGAFVGSSFPTYHWIHWASSLLAAFTHGILYALVPPWETIKY